MKQFVCTLDHIKSKKKLRKKVGIHYLLIVYYKDQVFAMKDKCPHMGYPLSHGRYEDGIIWCKEHGLSIHVDTGEVADQDKAESLFMDEYSRSVKTYQTSIIDGKVYVDK